MDADPQADLTTALGWPDHDNLHITLANVMENIIHDKDFVHFSGILHHDEGVDLMPSGIELSGMEMNLVNAMSREFTLRECLNRVKHEYNYVKSFGIQTPAVMRQKRMDGMNLSADTGARWPVNLPGLTPCLALCGK